MILGTTWYYIYNIALKAQKSEKHDQGPAVTKTTPRHRPWSDTDEVA